MRLIAARADLSVQGNRDLDWAERVDAATRDYVLRLPRFAADNDFVCTHGDSRLQRPLDAADVRRGAARTYTWLRERGARLGFFGHTHQARVWHKRGLDAPLEDVTADSVILDADPASVWLVNVGTVGMPFPGKDPPSCTLYEASASASCGSLAAVRPAKTLSRKSIGRRDTDARYPAGRPHAVASPPRLCVATARHGARRRHDRVRPRDVGATRRSRP